MELLTAVWLILVDALTVANGRGLDHLSESTIVNISASQNTWLVPLISACATLIAASGAAVIAVRQFALGRYRDRVDAARKESRVALRDVLGDAVEAEDAIRRLRSAWPVVPVTSTDEHRERTREISNDVLELISKLRNQRGRLRLHFPTGTDEYRALDEIVDKLGTAYAIVTNPDFTKDVADERRLRDESIGEVETAVVTYEAAAREYANDAGPRPSCWNRWQLADESKSPK